MKVVKTINPYEIALNHGLRKFSSAFDVCVRAICAYSDCQPEDMGLERDLNYFDKCPVNADEIILIMAASIPDGYNGFDPNKSTKAIVDVFGGDSKYFVAREGSPCIYVKPTKGNIWLSETRSKMQDIGADEILFDADLGMFRIWWD